MQQRWEKSSCLAAWLWILAADSFKRISAACVVSPRPEDYQGGRDSGSIVQFATEWWSKSAPAPEVKELVDDHVLAQVSNGNRRRSRGTWGLQIEQVKGWVWIKCILLQTLFAV